MPRDGAGTYSVPYPDFQPGTVIDQAQMDANFADIAAAISQSLASNGETTPTQDLPMGGRKFLNVADAALSTQFATANQIQRNSITWCGGSAGTGSAYTLTMAPAFTGSYAPGMRVQFRAHAANTASPTLNVSGLGAKGIQYMRRGALADLPAGMLAIGSIVEVLYPDAAVDKWILLTPATYAPGWYDIAQSVNAGLVSVVNFALPSQFSTFQLRLSDTSPTAAAPPYLRFSYDNGVSYTSSPFDYGYSFMSVAGSVVAGASATSSYCQLGETASETVMGTIDISAGTPTRGTFALTTYKPGPVLNFSSGGFNGPALTATHVQFGFVGTTVAGHRIKLVGGVGV